MNDEQRSMVLFQAQPEGPGAIFRPAALSFTHVDHATQRSFCLAGQKIDSGSTVWPIENTP